MLICLRTFLPLFRIPFLHLPPPLHSSSNTTYSSNKSHFFTSKKHFSIFQHNFVIPPSFVYVTSPTIHHGGLFRILSQLALNLLLRIQLQLFLFIHISSTAKSSFHFPFLSVFILLSLYLSGKVIHILVAFSSSVFRSSFSFIHNIQPRFIHLLLANIYIYSTSCVIHACV